MMSINYNIGPAARADAYADQGTPSGRTCHCCGEELTIAETHDDDAWDEDGHCYCAACIEADAE